MKYNEHVVKYWLKHYVGEVGICTLCGNSGVIDTTGVKSPNGQHTVGRKNYCICKNGQCIRDCKVEL